ncbi:MAG: restriction endonuclease subunit S [Marinilabiliales bacterium]|nr:restriction endonuclease subunit S [Marinilabiliales bacterium]
MNDKIYKPRFIPEGWQVKKISEVAKTGSGGTPLSTCKAYYEGGTIPWINSGEVGQYSIKSTPNFITSDGMKQSSAKLIPKGSVLLAMYGATAGKASLLEFEATTNQAICAIMPFEDYDYRFIKYYLDALYSYLVGVSTGSARDNLNQNGIQDIEIPFPKKELQNSIASVLSSLDSKIELNNRINTELEAMAKTLYDYWFVQFDFPDANGKPYKTSGGKMVWNEQLKREIPEGWEVKSLSNLTSIISRGISPSYVETEGVCVLNQKCIRGKTVLYSESRRHDNTNKSADSKRIELHDILVNSTGVGTLGRVAIVKRLPEDYVTVDSHVTIVRANSELVDKYFFEASLLEKQTEIEKFALGSTGQVELSRFQLEGIKLILPPQALQTKFSSLYSQFLNKMAICEEENQHLSSLRDWLLPMLMNGQVTVGGQVDSSDDFESSDELKAKTIYRHDEEIRMAAEPGMEK